MRLPGFKAAHSQHVGEPNAKNSPYKFWRVTRTIAWRGTEVLGAKLVTSLKKSGKNISGKVNVLMTNIVTLQQ